MRLPVKLLLAVGLTAATATAARAHEGWGIVRDATGRLYVADVPANTIWRIDPDGRRVAAVRGVHSHALVIGSDGAVYGTDVALDGFARVWRLDARGVVTTVVGPTQESALDLQPFLLEADGALLTVTRHQGHLPVNERKLFVVRRTPDGAVDTLAGGFLGRADGDGLNGRFAAIDGMAWLPDGSIALADVRHLRRLTLAGRVETIAGPLTERAWDQDLLGVSVGADGRVYVADFAQRRVLRVENGRATVVGSSGWYWSPSGVLVEGDGVVTLEHVRAPLGILGDLGVGPYLRVREQRTDGSVRVLTTVWGRYTATALLAAALVVAAAVVLVVRRRRLAQADRFPAPG